MGYWRASTEALKREACEGIREDREACGNQQHPENPKRKSSGQRCFNMPQANPPRDATRNGSRSNDQEYCAAENGEYPPRRREFYNAR